VESKSSDLGTGWSPNLQIWERAEFQIFKFGNVVAADQPGSNTSKSEVLDSSPVPKDTLLYQKTLASELITRCSSFYSKIPPSLWPVNFLNTPQWLLEHCVTLQFWCGLVTNSLVTPVPRRQIRRLHLIESTHDTS
jgi:hypothetical protein